MCEVDLVAIPLDRVKEMSKTMPTREDCPLKSFDKLWIAVCSVLRGSCISYIIFKSRKIDRWIRSFLYRLSSEDFLFSLIETTLHFILSVALKLLHLIGLSNRSGITSGGE